MIVDTLKGTIMSQIAANELKTRGIAAIESALAGGRTEAVLSVRGAERYVVMEMAHYQHLRECELEAALAETQAEIAAGRFVTESPDAHLARVQAMVADEIAPTSECKAKTAAARRDTGRPPGRSKKGSPPRAGTTTPLGAKAVAEHTSAVKVGRRASR